jgi:hypothetical protein
LTFSQKDQKTGKSSVDTSFPSKTAKKWRHLFTRLKLRSRQAISLATVFERPRHGVRVLVGMIHLLVILDMFPGAFAAALIYFIAILG